MPAAVETLEQLLQPFAHHAVLRRRPAPARRLHYDAMIVGLVMTVGIDALVLLTARMFSGVIREEPDPVAGIAMLTMAVCAVASLINGLAFR